MCFGNGNAKSLTDFCRRAAEGQRHGARRVRRSRPRRPAEAARARSVRGRARTCAFAAVPGSQTAAGLHRAGRRGGRGARARLEVFRARRGAVAGRRSAAVRGHFARPDGRAAAAGLAVPAAPRRGRCGGRLLGARPGPAGAAAGGARQTVDAGFAGDGTGPRRAGPQADCRRLHQDAAGRGPRHLRGPRRRLRRLVAARRAAGAARVLR